MLACTYHLCMICPVFWHNLFLSTFWCSTWTVSVIALSFSRSRSLLFFCIVGFLFPCRDICICGLLSFASYLILLLECFCGSHILLAFPSLWFYFCPFSPISTSLPWCDFSFNVGWCPLPIFVVLLLYRWLCLGRGFATLLLFSSPFC